MQNERIKTYEEFYQFYLNEHKKRGTRISHFVGTSLFLMFTLLALILGSPFWFLIGVICAYGLAWIGHFFIEHNKPATFKYPLWSLISDFKLYFEIIRGKQNFGN